MTPNEEQRAAIESDAPHITLLAGPGSGKTQTLSWRIARDAEQINPQRMVVVTFTNAGARVLRERLQGKAAGAYIGTLHAYAIAQIRANGLGIGFRQNLTVLDDSTTEDLMDTVLDRLKLGSKVSATDLLRALKSNASKSTPAGLAAVTYRNHLRANNCLTFDTALLELEHLLTCGAIAQPAKIYVDEAQDTSPEDAAIYRRMNAERSFWVGDVDQCVYEFRGADPRILLERSRAPEMQTLFLNRNHRSGNNIVSAANRLISHNTERVAKTMVAADSSKQGSVQMAIFDTKIYETAWLIRNVQETLQHGIKCAVLTRYNDHAFGIMEALENAGVPVLRTKPKGKDWAILTGALNALIDPMGAAAAPWAVHYTAEDRRVMNRAMTTGRAIASVALEMAGVNPADSIGEMLHKMRVPEGPAMQALRASWRGSLQEALTNIAETEAEEEGDPAGVYVGTMHSAKGREWPAVWLPGWTQETLPRTPERAESERRLAYVGITRAQSRVTITASRSELGTSQFLEEAIDRN